MLNKIISDIFSIFYPNICSVCKNELIEKEQGICLFCLLSFSETGHYKHLQKNPIYYRLAGKVDIAGAASLFHYSQTSKIRTVIFQLKYHQSPQIGIMLGEYFGSKLISNADLQKVTAIVPVPIHWKKRSVRGYNQAEYFAQGLSNKLNIPVNNEVVKKVTHTISQTKMSRHTRWTNLKGGFKCMNNPPENVILVDDVITTGATIVEIGSLLLLSGVKKLFILSIASPSERSKL